MSEENQEKIEEKEIQKEQDVQEVEQENVEGGTGETTEEITENEGIQISNDVIAVISGVAVSEVQGVSSMAGGFAGGISEVLSGKKNMSKGIKVDVQEKNTKIDVNIIVEYGARIPDVAFEIQKRVKKSVESMTGLTVTEVNVHVQGVNTNLEKKEEKVVEKKEEKPEKKDDKKKEEKK